MRPIPLLRVLLGGSLILVLLGAIVYPSSILIWQAFSRDGDPTLANLAAILSDPDVWHVLWNSMHVSIWATLLGVALGTGLAFLVARTDLPGQRFFRAALLLPYLIPPFIAALAWLALAGPVGFINQLWMAMTGLPEPLFQIYGAPGIVMGHGVIHQTSCPEEVFEQPADRFVAEFRGFRTFLPCEVAGSHVRWGVRRPVEGPWGFEPRTFNWSPRLPKHSSAKWRSGHTVVEPSRCT